MSVTKVLLDILVVLFAAKMAAKIAERVGLPAVVGEIIAERMHRYVRPCRSTDHEGMQLRRST